MLSVVGRNGMGKTTLCKTIMGLVRASSGSIRVRGEDILSLPPAQIARLGVGYVPQGRRLWRSLTVDEHLRMIAGLRRGAWTVERIYDTFPRLAERKSNGGGQLSGGEQQMLAISRALMTNPRLLIMDEPTEGLAPVIVAQVEEMLVRLGEESDIAILVIEQNIGVATAVSENVAIMVNGRVNRIIESRAARRRPRPAAAPARRRTPRRGRAGHRRRNEARSRGAPRRSPAAKRRRRSGSMSRTRRRRRAGRSRSPIARIEASARIASSGAPRLEDTLATTPRRGGRASSGPPAVLVVGTLDTKGEELRFIRDIVAGSGLRARLVDVSTSGKLASCDVSAQEIALNHPRGGSAVFGPDRGASVTAMAEAFDTWLKPPDRHRRHHLRGRLGRRLDRRAGDARAADRRAEADDLLGRLRRRRPLCRTRRHHDDVFGHRRAGPELDLAPGAGERRPGADRDGEGAA